MHRSLSLHVSHCFCVRNIQLVRPEQHAYMNVTVELLIPKDTVTTTGTIEVLNATHAIALRRRLTSTTISAGLSLRSGAFGENIAVHRGRV